MSYSAVLQAFNRNNSPMFPGSSSLKDHNSWVELISYNYGINSHGVQIGNPTVDSSFLVSDMLSGILATACASGTQYVRIMIKTFDTTDTGNAPYMQVELRKATLVSLQLSGRPEPQTARISISYTERVVIYRDAKSKNNQDSGAWIYESASP